MRFALLPAKPIALAKSRLSARYAPLDRERIAIAMFRDVLDAILGARSIDRTLVVSADPDLLSVSRSEGAVPVDESSPRGLNGAAMLGTREAIDRGATSVVVILSDLPMARPEEIEALLASTSARPHVRMVRSHEGLGTNALLRQPPLVVPTRFGGSSFQGHIAACADAAVPWTAIELPGLAFDVDTPEDLGRLAGSTRSTRTSLIASELGALRSRAH